MYGAVPLLSTVTFFILTSHFLAPSLSFGAIIILSQLQFLVCSIDATFHHRICSHKNNKEPWTTIYHPIHMNVLHATNPLRLLVHFHFIFIPARDHGTPNLPARDQKRE
jgi:hypothetical protein